MPRPEVRGKFLYAGDEKLIVKGVTYGTFRPDAEGRQFPLPAEVRADFAQMRANGVNAVRTYTPPPRWLLDEAQAQGLRVMVGLPWEQHIAFLDEPGRAEAIKRRVQEAAAECAQHPALLCFAVGNEIPASIVRWHGRRQVERFLRELYEAVKSLDPQALVTYVNFPTTEYLETGFFDFFSFNVYLESRATLRAYLARLHTLAGDKPLLMAEVGLDSRRNGELHQAEALDWQIETVFTAGCAGVFVFAWTDEWYRGGFDIDDWDFGLVTRDRQAKKALLAVRSAFADPLQAARREWPFISVVICTYNGSRTLEECLSRVVKLSYPTYEVIVVNDGSTDGSEEIARRHPVKLISTKNGGLSRARNVGAEAARGDIVAYLDDDAYPDEHWLHFLAIAYLEHPEWMGAGGPNVPPPGDGLVAQAVSNSPGGPLHVLVSDEEAEHIPGCNSSFRREALQAAGGFDPTFRVAGDDVDLCWRILDRGWKIGFHPGAVVWHHRRNHVSTYLKQQRGYGRAEALLARKHPNRYNSFGHIAWQGRVYGTGLWKAIGFAQPRVYHGSWNSAPFQGLYQPQAGLLASFAQAPEWYAIAAVMVVMTLLGLEWRPMLVAAPLLAMAILVPAIQLAMSVRRAEFPEARSDTERGKLRLLTALLYATQPLARLWGRVTFGLTPWRTPYEGRPWCWPSVRTATVWSEQWRSSDHWLVDLHKALEPVNCGGDWDGWDLEVRRGMLGAARVTMAVEEHGAGKQLLRFRIEPRLPVGPTVAFGCLVLAAAGAAYSHAWLSALFFTIAALWLVASGIRDSGVAVAESREAATGLRYPQGT
jgi:glycosyltransferase involved in cell wall biosynthesis